MFSILAHRFPSFGVVTDPTVDIIGSSLHDDEKENSDLGGGGESKDSSDSPSNADTEDKSDSDSNSKRREHSSRARKRTRVSIKSLSRAGLDSSDGKRLLASMNSYAGTGCKQGVLKDSIKVLKSGLPAVSTAH
ncbi:unnamed protein product [Dibothriocephalus latus]|uniref:Uncharacterized protein n=1 Tax=Dibothriocephalus latus TaxID=60516 RepID=A0A3P7KVD5_DIBLA|nr:unnamed protein product [Dibothriocephalus latus]